MLRRDARLRKEFLYKKALEQTDRELNDRKKRLKDALESNKPIPAELKKEASLLAQALAFDDNVSGNYIIASLYRL